MKIGIHNNYLCYSEKNKIFDKKSYTLGENLYYPMKLLKEELSHRNFSLDTLDMHHLDEFDKIIFLDYPSSSNFNLDKLHKNAELYLILLESENIKKDNWDKTNHKYFKKVFTWNQNLVDNIKYFDLKLSNKVPKDFKIEINSERKFCINISGNKKNNDPNELYSERRKIIKWFNKNHPSDFDLYGFGWDKFCFGYPLGRLNRFNFLTKLLKPRLKFYRGSVDSKYSVLKNYTFSVCFENIKSTPGYITEKIFDCFFCGTIPIYWGPEEITDFIPSSCFIDIREFNNYDELYNYMKNMTDERYKEYLQAIEDFVNSKDIYIFSAECYTKTITDNIL